MLRKYAAIFNVFIVGVALSFSHAYSPVTAGQSSPHSPSGQHAQNSDCKTPCQATLKDKKNNPDYIKEEDDVLPDITWPSEVTLASVGVGILQPDTLLQQSSWRPPDTVLLSGQYSTSL